MWSHLQAVESFHLQCARLLCAGPDKDCFAIKDGCKLRFFFESVRNKALAREGGTDHERP
jgi:hypothetical protein